MMLSAIVRDAYTGWRRRKRDDAMGMVRGGLAFGGGSAAGIRLSGPHACAKAISNIYKVSRTPGLGGGGPDRSAVTRFFGGQPVPCRRGGGDAGRRRAGRRGRTRQALGRRYAAAETDFSTTCVSCVPASGDP